MQVLKNDMLFVVMGVSGPTHAHKHIPPYPTHMYDGAMIRRFMLSYFEYWFPRRVDFSASHVVVPMMPTAQNAVKCNWRLSFKAKKP